MSKQKIDKTSEELQQQFEEQITLIKLACDSFDS